MIAGMMTLMRKLRYCTIENLMVRTVEILIIGGVLVIVPLGMGGIPLVKLLFFALAVLIGTTTLSPRHQAVVDFCGTGLHSLARQIRTVSVGAPCSPVPHCMALWFGRMTQSFLFVFFTVVFLSPLWSTASTLSIVGVEPRFEGVMAYVVFFGLALLAWGMVRAGREQNLLRVILWSNVGVVSYGLLQLVGMDPFAGWWDADVFLGRVFSTVGQPNMLGQFLLLTAPFAMLTAWWRGGRGAALGVLGGNLLVLFATGSRAGMVGVIVGVCVWILVTLRCEQGVWFVAPTLCCGAPHHDTLRATKGDRIADEVVRMFCGAGIFLFIGIVGFFLFSQRFTLPGEWERSVGSRLMIWRDAVTMIRARPRGWGLETTGLIFPRFQSAPLTAYESLTTSVDRAHNKPFDLLLTVGPLGLLAYYGFLTMLVVHCLREWRRHRDGLALAGVVSLLGVSVSLLFGFESIVVHAFFWLTCGMLLGRFLSPMGRELERGGKGIPLLGIFTLCLFVAVAFTLLSLSSRITANHAERMFQEGDLGTAAQEYARATRQVPWDRALLIRFLETALLARERAEDQETEHAIDTVLEKHLHALRWLTSGSDLLLPSLQAWHAALGGKMKEALGFLEDAKRRAPFSIPRLRIAGKVAQLLGDKTMENTLRTELKSMLPSWWSDASDPRRRILLKENPWVEEFSPSPFEGRG